MADRGVVKKVNMDASTQSELEKHQLNIPIDEVINTTFSWIPQWINSDINLRIDSIYADTRSGSCDLDFKINGSNISGLNNIAVNTNGVTENATGSNVLTSGDKAELTIKNNVDADWLQISIEYTTLQS